MANRTIQELLDMHGKVAIVTGGGTHLGRAMTESLSELGAEVHIASRRLELCEETAAEMRSRGLKVHAHGCDATQEDQVRALVESVVEKAGRLDVMVANAGGNSTTSHPPYGSLAEFRNTFELNVVSTFLSAQEAAKFMIPQGKGAIVTIGSIASRLAMDPRIYETTSFMRSGTPYITAKAAVLNLTRALAAEFGPHGVRVNCISPGQIPNEQSNKEQAEIFRQMNAFHRTGLAEDLKGAVALLATDAGAWMTGQEVLVDGGWSIW